MVGVEANFGLVPLEAEGEPDLLLADPASAAASTSGGKS